MSITIPNPQTKTWIQPNNSDIFGTIAISQGIDVQENYGRMRLGRRLIVNSKSSDAGLSALYNPVAFVSYNNAIYTLGGSSGTGSIFKSGNTELGNNFVVDTSGTEPTDIDSIYSDMVLGSNGNLYATSGSKLYECYNGSWRATTNTLTPLYPHMLAVYASRLYVSNRGNEIYSCSIATDTMGNPLQTTGSYSLTLSIDTDTTIITFIRASASQIWIGTVNTKGGKGYIYAWDGQSTLVSQSYRLESSGALSCVIKDEIPYVVDTNGDLFAFNGGTFQKLTGFNRKNGKARLLNATRGDNTRFIHPNGMSVVNGRVNILINNLNGDSAGTVEESIPSGVWEYTQENGLIHKHGFTLAKDGDTITDYCQSRVLRVGALTEIITRSQDVDSNTNGTFLAGGAIYTDATSSVAVISYEDTNDTLQKTGIYVTPMIEASGAKDTFQKIFAKYKRLLNSTDKFVIKSRTVDVAPTEATITFVNTTSFTTTTDISAYAIGDEVEFIQGVGAGRTAHITNITGSGTYTVTVDETITGATTQTAKARFGKWNKVGEVSGQVEQLTELSIPANDQSNVMIQFKLWFLFTGKNELYSIDIISQKHKPLV